MGCFSFICQVSGKSITSTSYEGDACRLYLLKDGVVIEEMYGHYDSYGRVFDGKGDSFKWNTPWNQVCDLMFNGSERDGIAAVLECYFDGNIPTTQSEGDPNQGWDEPNGKGVVIDKPYHKIISTLKSIEREEKIDTVLTSEDRDSLRKLVKETEALLARMSKKSL